MYQRKPARTNVSKGPIHARRRLPRFRHPHPSPLAARATTIDDFTYTDGTHTIEYSLPATFIFPEVGYDPPNFTETASATIDGVSGYTLKGVYSIEQGFGIPMASLSVPISIFGTSQLVFYELRGPIFVPQVTVPISNPPLFGPFFNVVATFSPGTYALAPGTFNAQTTDPYTLTVTPEVSSVPEPSTLVLLATGTLAAYLRRRFGQD